MQHMRLVLLVRFMVAMALMLVVVPVSAANKNKAKAATNSKCPHGFDRCMSYLTSHGRSAPLAAKICTDLCNK